MTRSRTLRAVLLVTSGLAGAGVAQCGGGSAETGAPDAAGTDARADRPEAEAQADDGTAADVRDGGLDTADTAIQDAWRAPDAPPDSGADTGTILDSSMPIDARDAAGDADASPSTCDNTHPCSGQLVCCSGTCVDLQHDPRNCGSCARVCAATQFCTGTRCDDAVFANVCANGTATVLEDPYLVDDEAGAALGGALATACSPGASVRYVQQLDGGALAFDAGAGGRPNTGVGTTIVAGGGWFGQLAVAYMDQSALTPLYATSDGTTARIVNRSSGSDIVNVPMSTLGAQHDYFFIELAVEPVSGTLCLFGVGLLSSGTEAAGYYGGAVMVPNRATLTTGWYAYEWTDTSNDGWPGAGDTFSLVGQGP